MASTRRPVADSANHRAPANRKGPSLSATPGSSQSRLSQPARMKMRTESWLQIVREEWDTLVQQIKNQRLPRRNQPDLPPYEQEVNYWKREIYQFVCQHLDNETGKYLDLILQEGVVPSKSPRFKDNPFHLALYATKDQLAEKDQRWKVSRYGKQLVYARRHRVPAELLIGFLHQTGTPDQVCSKANHPETFEPWRAEFLARLKNPGGTPG